MFAAARRMLVILAALFLSAGHVACACASVSAPVTQIVEAESADLHAHHHGDVDGADEDAPAPAHPDCSHCKSVALAGDSAAKSAALPALSKTFAVAASAFPSLSRDFSVGIRAQRLHWAAPPRRTPVSLKIRLRN